MAQSVKLLTLDFSSGHDLAVRFVSSSPASGSAVIVQSLLGILSLSLSLCPSPASSGASVLSLSLSLSHLILAKRLRSDVRLSQNK